MKLIPHYSALCAIAVSISTAQAGTVEQAVVVAEPQMQVKDGAIQGCGYRFKSVPRSFEGLRSVLVLDTSFNVYAEGLVLLKGGAIRVAVKEGSPGQSTNTKIETFWMKAQGEMPTRALGGKVIPAENQGYLLYGETMAAVTKLFSALAEGTPLTFGVRVKGEGLDRIYSGVAQLSDQDREQGAQCLSDLVKQMENDLEQKVPDR